MGNWRRDLRKGGRVKGGKVPRVEPGKMRNWSPLTGSRFRVGGRERARDRGRRGRGKGEEVRPEIYLAI